MFWHSEFRPLQPNPGSGEGSYQEILPIPALQSLLYCIWKLEWSGASHCEPAYYIVPDGTTDLLLTREEGKLQFYISVTGKTAQQIDLPPDSIWLGFRFFPGAFSYLFSVSLEGLAAASLPAAEVLPVEDLQFLESLRMQQIPDLIGSVQHWLGQKSESLISGPDGRIVGAIQQLHTWQTGFQVNKDLEAYLSQRQTRRKIEEATGLSPKSLWRVFRLQQILRDPMARQGFFAMKDLGFTDQAHFIHDFKRLTGKTPGAFWLDEG